MPLLRVVLGLICAYVVLALLAWLFQDRLALPSPRGTVSDPTEVVVPTG